MLENCTALNSTPPPWQPEVVENYLFVLGELEKILQRERGRRRAAVSVVGEKSVRVPAHPGDKEKNYEGF